jgi:CheY-like chemotaxis protein
MASARRILVVDDDPIARDLAASALRGQGYEVATAARYMTALDEVRAHKPHLLLTDIVLPDGSGPELATVLRHELPRRDMPIVILMSAFSRGRIADQRQLKEETGAVGFVQKPLAIPALLDLVGQHLPRGGDDPAPPAPIATPDAAARAVPAAPAAAPAPPLGPAAGPAAPPAAAPAAAVAKPPAAARPAAPARPQAAPARPAQAPPGQTLLLGLANAWRKGWTGTFAVSRSGAEKTIVLDRGQIVWATTSLADERLGRVVMRLGLVPRDLYEASLKEAAETKRRVGDVLVARGHLAPYQLEDAMVQQVEGIVLNALAWPDGSYRVTVHGAKPASETRVNVSPVPRLVLRAFLDGVISDDRLDARLQAVGEQLLVRRPEVPAGALAQLAPTPEEGHLLEALRTPMRAESLLSLHPRGPCVAAPFLGALLTLGIVGPAGGAAEPREPELAPAPAPAAPAPPIGATERAAAEAAARRLLEAEGAFEEARLAVDRDDLGAAAAAIARAAALCPNEGEYRAWAAWVRALAARKAFDATLDAVAHEMEDAAGLTPSAEGIYELIEQVIRLRMLARERDARV